MPMPRSLQGVSCVVLGGGGFIGRALIKALLAEGAVVRGFGRVSRFGEPATSLPWIYGSFEDQVALARAVEGMEVVFHLAGGSTPERSNAAPVGDLMASVAGSVELLEICRAEGARRIVFATSGGTVYGAPKVVPIPETAPTDPISDYGVHKLAVEKYLHLYGYLHRLEHVSLRISNPFGPYQDPLRRQGLVAAALMKLLRGQAVDIWGDGSVVRDYIYIDDVAEALLRAAGYDGAHRVFNIGTGTGMSVNAVVDEAAAVLAIANPAKVHLPGRKADVPVNVLDITLARRELGWVPRTAWRDAILRTVEWMRYEPSVKALLDKGHHG